MIRDEDKALQVVYDYHEQTKHHFRRYALSLGYMDWATQPDPFRRYDGAERLTLDHPTPWALPSYDQLFGDLAARPMDRAAVSRLFYNSLALSAWKQLAGGPAWSLRVNPSSGALHPTEGYLITGPVPGLSETGGVFHYAPHLHALERRRTLPDEHWAGLAEGWPNTCQFVALTSIYWRESWKYGERAFRYCHLDVGHAVGAVALAAQLLGWRARLVPMAAADLGLLLGVDALHGSEAEHPDCVLALFPPTPGLLPSTLVLAPALRPWLVQNAPAGQPNRLSKSHHAWPIIDDVAEATREPEPGPVGNETASATGRSGDAGSVAGAGRPAEQIIRQRRSAVDMDGEITIARARFFRMLARVVPELTPAPFAVLSGPPRVALALFVHRIDGLAAGLYLLARDARHEADLRGRLARRFLWQKPAACPDALRLFLLVAGDVRHQARRTSCYQDIAADGVFAAAMLAEFEATLQVAGPASYRRLHWEAGLIGQVLYLEAEAADIRATGIGCFFDDATHELLGLQDRAWQTVYHFTAGGPVADARLQTLAPYYHLDREEQD